MKQKKHLISDILKNNMLLYDERQIVINNIKTDYGIRSNGDVISYKLYGSNTYRYLQPIVNSRGYYFVNLFIDGKPILCYIHRLVAEHFIPNPYNKPQVNHINGKNMIIISII